MLKKSTKRFTFTSEAKNSKGFHVRTKGIELHDFRTNPLLLWMHQRPKGERSDEILPLGEWQDLQDEPDGKQSGVPAFDSTDEFAMKIMRKVENGTIKMASAGLLPLQFITDNEGEKWLERSVLKEISLVDIGSNSEALSVALYNNDQEIVNLSFFEDLQKPKTDTSMKLIQLSEGTISLLKLAEGANEADAHSAILNLVTLADSQKAQLATLKADKEKAEKAVKDLEKLAGDSELIALVDDAEKARKITADQKPIFLKLSLENAKEILDGMKGAPTVADSINTQKHAGDKMLELSYDELDKSGQLVTLKEENLEGFKAKFKEKFKTDYKG